MNRVILKRDFIIYLFTSLVLITIISFSLVSFTVKKDLDASEKKVKEITNDLLVLGDIEQAIMTHIELLRQIRNIPEKDSKKSTYPKVRITDTRKNIEQLSDKKALSDLYNLLILN